MGEVQLTQETQQRQLFILQGNGPILNRGCEAILRATVAILKIFFPSATFMNAQMQGVHPKGHQERDATIRHLIPKQIKRWRPYWFRYQLTKRLFGMPRTPFAFERYLNDAAAVLAIGGDNYTLDYGRPTRFFDANRIVLDAGLPLIIWGASVGPFTKDPEFEAWAANELRQAHLICARESETVRYLGRIGVKDNVKEVADPAFLLAPEPVQLRGPEAVLLREQCVGLNLSPLLGTFFKGDSWLAVATDIVRAVLEGVGMPVVLVPHVLYGTMDDHVFMARVLRGLRGYGDRLVLVGRDYSAQQLKWIISQFHVFAGARTHSTIASLGGCVPTVSIGYSMKARGINKDIFGGEDWLIPIEQISAARVVSTIRELLRQAGAVRSHLAGFMPTYREKARIAGRYLRDIVLECGASGAG